jgi:GAF domain/ANTAR domain
VSAREDLIAEVLALVDEAEPPADSAGGTMARLQRLCVASVRDLRAFGAGVTVMTEDGLQSVAIGADSRSQLLEEQQFSFGEGPCAEAFASRRPVLEPDLGLDAGRWPGYASAAHRQGVRAVFAFPLQVGAARLGVLDVYREQAGPLSTATLVRALTFADVAVLALLDGQREVAAGRQVAGLQPAVESRSELFQAQGMVMIQLGVSLTEAMTRIRAYAYGQDRGLGEVARDVVAGRLNFQPKP